MAKKTITPVFKPPVVTIMGHVDHGKTTLLDAIRESNLAAKEAGGITQKIGAYQVTFQSKKITFIDTPGHAAFSKMRAQGARSTDIVILVVAADDGVKPQTKESIEHIKQAAVPFIVAINKIDAPGASVPMVKAQLSQEGIMVEGYGGNVPVVEISARNKINIDKLLETILVLAEMENITASSIGPLLATVIESSLKKNVGPVATILIKTGTLKSSDTLIAVVPDDPSIEAKIRRMNNDVGAVINTALPGDPVEILGFKQVPPVGSILTLPKDKATIEATLKFASDLVIAPESALVPTRSMELVPSEEKPQTLKIILKVDTVGSLEAIRQNLPSEVELIKAATGEVSESDVMLAKNTGAFIVAFNTKINSAAKKLAELETVLIKFYTIIYKLFEDFEKLVLKLLEPTIDEEELGTAKVQALFDIKDNLIAGCQVATGQMSLHDAVHLKRDNKFISDSRIVSLKQAKSDVSVVKAGNECGLVLKPKLDIKPGDTLISYRKIAGVQEIA